MDVLTRQYIAVQATTAPSSPTATIALDASVGGLTLSALAMILAAGVGWLGNRAVQGVDKAISETRQQSQSAHRESLEAVRECSQRHENAIKEIDRQAHTLELQVRDLRVDLASNYVHRREFTHQSMVLHGTLDALREDIKALAISVESIRKGHND